MRFFRRQRQSAAEETQPATPETDLHERARPGLEAKAATNPRLAALLAEVDRGNERAAMRRSSSQTEATMEAEAEPTPLHAHEITPNDAAFMRTMAGAKFGEGVTLTLPSGKTITGAEMQRWLDAQT